MKQLQSQLAVANDAVVQWTAYAHHLKQRRNEAAALARDLEVDKNGAADRQDILSGRVKDAERESARFKSIADKANQELAQLREATGILSKKNAQLSNDAHQWRLAAMKSQQVAEQRASTPTRPPTSFVRSWRAPNRSRGT